MTKTIPNLDLWMEPSPFQNRNAYLQKNHNWSVLQNNNYQLSTFIQNSMDDFTTRFNQQIKATQQPNEVVDARIDSWGKTWHVLKDRLDNEEQTATHYTHDSYSNATFELVLRDVTASSTGGMSYEKIKDLASIKLPALGYTSTTSDKLTYDIAD